MTWLATCDSYHQLGGLLDAYHAAKIACWLDVGMVGGGILGLMLTFWCAR
jgi:hypothetical protein